MTAKDFYQPKRDLLNFSKLTSTGISTDYEAVFKFAEDYYNYKTKIIGDRVFVDGALKYNKMDNLNSVIQEELIKPITTLTESEKIALIPRFKNKKLDCKRFHEVNLWKKYGIYPKDYLSKDDVNELYKYVNNKIRTHEDFKNAFENKEDWIMEIYNDNLKAIQEYEDTLEE